MNHEILAALFDVPRVLVRPSGRRVEVRTRPLGNGIVLHQFLQGSRLANVVDTGSGAVAVMTHGMDIVMSTVIQYDDPGEQREAVEAMLRQMPWWVDA